ncbi:hypothetical protein CMEL01_13276 [Colletotrichum melonis]|uniref:Uncharacterized protein n=1 Tax=Colletotrichum melonis TaxID=1209925 RepID=A0AAI9URK1_9PEZI|nr:hypothetical protein CMEL01_13276 [Colletotrichum melonis]
MPLISPSQARALVTVVLVLRASFPDQGRVLDSWTVRCLRPSLPIECLTMEHGCDSPCLSLPQHHQECRKAKHPTHAPRKHA